MNVLKIEYPPTFMFLLGQYHLSPFGETGDELEEDLNYARQASRRE